MRMKRAFLSCAVVAALGLLATGTTMAGGSHHGHTGGGGSGTPTSAPPPPPTSCTVGQYTIAVTSGPSFVSCQSDQSRQCTEIEYAVTDGGIPDHVAALEGVGVQYVVGPGTQWYPPCVGDPVTDIGEHSCHEQAAKFNPTGSSQAFTIGLDGQRSSGPTTVAVKKGSFVGSCRIVGVGLDRVPGQFESVQAVDTKTFEGCAVKFTYDAAGAVLSATLDGTQSSKPLCSQNGNNPPCCSDLTTTSIDKLTFSLEGVGDLGAGQVGDGYFSSGTSSCTTRIIGGRVYTWGSPCPN
jgi:hypothetical protein